MFMRYTLIITFKEISENKVYKSGVIPPEKIADLCSKIIRLKSVIDLRFPHTLQIK